MRMHRLMGTSPIINHSAVVHSNSELDLSILEGSKSDGDGEVSIEDDEVCYSLAIHPHSVL
jgi:hypothetical protein